MIKKYREEIIDLAKKNQSITVQDVLQIVDADRSSVYRFLKELVEGDILITKKRGIYTYRQSTEEYFETPFFKRAEKSYNKEFLEKYIPNKSSFFSEKQIQQLHKSVNKISLDTNFFRENKRLLEIMLVDLSFASSSLEGNTYSYLDTEILVQYNEIAKEKQRDETQMILNHKKTLEYLIYYKDKLSYKEQVFREVQSIL